MNSARQRGVALAIVVWFIAGMSLLVAGIVSRATVDTRLAQAHLFRAQAEAAGDGAARLLLAELLGGRLDANTVVPSGRYRLGAHDVLVVAVPTALLVDVNAVQPPVLETLLRRVAALDPEAARALAVNVVEWRRSGGEVPPRPMRFDVVEDLLRVEGMTRTRLDDLRHMVTAAAPGSARPNLDLLAALAPSQVLADGVPERRADSELQRRASSFRIDALVTVGDQQWLRRRWVELGGGAGSGLPWRARRAEAVRAVVTP